MKSKTCRTPSVSNCLNCKRPFCDCPQGVPMHESEIMAEVIAGVTPMIALTTHKWRTARKKARQR